MRCLVIVSLLFLFAYPTVDVQDSSHPHHNPMDSRGPTHGNSSGAVYYVDVTSGNDGNDGRSIPNAWQTVAQVNGSTFNPRDTIRFKRGETWAEQLTVPNSGTSGSPITFTAYGTGADPIITASNARPYGIYGDDKHYITISGIEVNGWLNTGIANYQGTNWTITGNTVEDGGNDSSPDHGIRVYTSDGGALLTGIAITNNTIGTINSSENDTAGRNGIIVQGVDDAVISGNTVETTNTVGIRVILNSVATGDNTDVVIENNTITGSYGNLLVSNTDGAIIRRNIIYDTKGCGICVAYDSDNADIYYNLVHDITSETTNLWNGIDINYDSQDGEVYNNTIYAVDGNSFVIDDETAACDGWAIKNNIFDAYANTSHTGIANLAWRLNGAGISWTSDYNNLRPATSTNQAVWGSLEEFVGTEDDAASDDFTGWTEAVATGTIEAVTTANANLATIPDGTYAAEMTKGIGGAQDIRYSIPLISGVEYTVSFQSKSDGTGTARGAIFKSDYSTYLQNDNSWGGANWNHTSLATTTSTSWSEKSVTFTAPSSGSFVIRNENYTNSASTYMDHLQVVSDGVMAYDTDGTTFYTLPTWQAAKTQEANSIVDDPLFTAVGTDDFTLQTGSPAINTGVDVGLTSDILGNPIVGLPDMGCYEVQ